MTTNNGDGPAAQDALSERVARLEGAYEHLATKADIADLRTELLTEIAQLRGEFRVEMARMETRLLLRLGGLVLVGLAVAAAIGRFVG